MKHPAPDTRWAPGRPLSTGLAWLIHRRRPAVLGCAAMLLGAAFIVIATGAARARLVSPDATVLLHDRHGRFLGDIGGNDQTGFGYWPVDSLPPRVVAATLAVEDRRFWSHPGVDPVAILRAVRQNLGSGRRVSGASTIAMQVARMQSPGSRTYARKAVEAVTALCLTARYGREQVLRHYLRIVPYSQQIHGIAHAARRYLDKPVADLSWAEVAFLAGIPQAPARMNPFDARGRRRAVTRGQRILDLLLEDGLISTGEHELASLQIQQLRVPRRRSRPDEALHAVLGLEQALAGGSHRAVVSNRPVVYTTIDLELQREVAWLTLRRLTAWEARGAGNGAVVVVDRSTREVVAWVGSSDYFDDQHAGAIDYARVPRSSGSTLKPFLYALALERGIIDPATVLDDLERAAGGIGNADERFLGPLLPRSALACSRNVPAANLLASIGLDEAYSFLADLRLHDRGLSASHYGLGLAVGGLPVTLEQLVTAYTTLADDGRLGELRWYRRQPITRPRRIVSEATARLITLFLADPMARLPAFPRMGWLEYPFPVAVKTGTSSGYRDAWTVAWSRQYLVGVWIGHPDARPMSRLSGYRSAARLVNDVMMLLHRRSGDGLEDVGFPPPRGWRPVRLCALTGRRATAATDRTFVEYLAPGSEPVEPSNAHVRLAVDRRNGHLATPSTPRSEVEVRTFVELDARYASWQLAQDLPRPPQAVSRLGSGSSGRLAPVQARTPHAAHRVSAVTITSPPAGLHILRDPETPRDRATVALRAVVDPPVEQLVWYVDGAPFAVSDYPYTARWPIEPGEHSFQARVPFAPGASSTVRVHVE